MELSCDDPELCPQSSPWHLRALDDWQLEVASSLFDIVSQPEKEPPQKSAWITYRPRWPRWKPAEIKPPEPPKPPPKPKRQYCTYRPFVGWGEPKYHGFPVSKPPTIEGFECALCGKSWVCSTRLYPRHRIRYALRPTAVFNRVVSKLISKGFAKVATGIYFKTEKRRLMTIKTLTYPFDPSQFWIQYDLKLP